MGSDTSMIMSDASPAADDDERHSVRHFVVAVDFGTTFSSVAYVGYTHEHQRKHLDLSNIELVDQYPDWSHSNYAIHDVPTELWYPSPGQRQDDTNGLNDSEQMMGSSSVSEEDESDSDSDSGQAIQRSKAPPTPIGSGATPPLHWGYSVQRQVQTANTFDGTKRISLSKLLPYDDPETKKARRALEETCAVLRKMGLIKVNSDVIAHYLEQLFRHAQSRLVEEGYTQDSRVEFVLCVPAIWKARACRYMHAAMSQAIEKSGFGNLQNRTINNLFIVSEPEAAALTAVQSGKISFKIGETVLILDAGGATVDAATYTVDETLPLRFKTEVVELGGDLCGSCYINRNFEDLLITRLSDEHYLKRDGEDMSRVIDRLLVDFEAHNKRTLDRMFPDQLESRYLFVDGLRKNSKKHFLPNRIRLSRKEIKALFMPSAEKVAQLMKGQIDKARGKPQPRHVQKVILLGGYGQSKSLAAHLKEVLSKEPRYQGIELQCPKLMSTVVAQGAVLRALRKEEGPNRVSQSSYGFLTCEHYMDEDCEAAHSQQKPFRDPIDGQEYIENTIRWEIHKGTTIAAETIVQRDVEYTFAFNKGTLKCKETLFVSDGYPERDLSRADDGVDSEFPKHESHYRYTHPKNADAEVAGEIEFDVTHLKNTDMVKKMPAPAQGMFPYWKVWATLSIIVDGRNLRYEMRLRNEGVEVKARAVGQESLAAAFKPGTE